MLNNGEVTIEIKTPETEKVSVTCAEIYKALVREEQRPPNPAELIPIGVAIKKEDVEFQKLISVGLSQEQILKGKIPREKLQEAGYIFNNVPFAFIEKPLIKGTINGVDYGQRKLLTADELNEVKEYQQLHPEEFHLNEVDKEMLREDILSFLMSAPDPRPVQYQGHINTLRLALDRMDAPFSNYEEKARWEKQGESRLAVMEKNLAKQYWESISSKAKVEAEAKGENFNSIAFEQKFVFENLHDEVPWGDENIFSRYPLATRGHQVSIFDSRTRKLVGTPSPFLDSGFHFPGDVAVDEKQTVFVGNPDTTVLSADKKSVFRVNLVVFHLLSHGLSEMGDGEGKSEDQDYNAGRFISELYERDDTKRNILHEQENQKLQQILNWDDMEFLQGVQNKIIRLALNWAETAKPQAQKLASEIRNLETQQGNKSWKQQAARLSNVLQRVVSKFR